MCEKHLLNFTTSEINRWVTHRRLWQVRLLLRLLKRKQGIPRKDPHVPWQRCLSQPTKGWKYLVSFCSKWETHRGNGHISDCDLHPFDSVFKGAKLVQETVTEPKTTQDWAQHKCWACSFARHMARWGGTAVTRGCFAHLSFLSPFATDFSWALQVHSVTFHYLSKH